MLRSKRFWTAAVLLAVLLCCLTARAFSRCSQPEPVPQPVQTASETAAPLRSETAQTQTALLPTTAEQTVTETTARREPSAKEPELPAWKLSELRDKTAELSAKLSDFVGWLYMADSAIDYPVMQGRDNQYYLHHAPDGSYLKRGAIFLDYRCARDMRDPANILFGHNMVSGMFGDIRAFRTQAEFDAHCYGWFITPDTVWRIDFFVLAVTDAFDALYDLPADSDAWRERLHETAEFERDMPLTDEDSLIALSTCTFGDTAYARALLTGKLVKTE